MPANPIFPYAPPLTSFVPNIPLAPQTTQGPSVTDITTGVSQVTLNQTPTASNYEPTPVSSMSTPTHTSQDCCQNPETIQTSANATSVEQLFASVPATNSPSLIESFTAPPTSYPQYAGGMGVQQQVSGN